MSCCLPWLSASSSYSSHRSQQQAVVSEVQAQEAAANAGTVRDPLVPTSYVWIFKNYTNKNMRICMVENQRRLRPTQQTTHVGMERVGVAVGTDVILQAGDGMNDPQCFTVPKGGIRKVTSKSRKVYLRGGPEHWAYVSREQFFEHVFENFPVFHCAEKNESHEIPITAAMCGLSVNKYFTDVLPGSREMDRTKEEAMQVPLRFYWLPWCKPEAGSDPRVLLSTSMQASAEPLFDDENSSRFFSRGVLVRIRMPVVPVPSSDGLLACVRGMRTLIRKMTSEQDTCCQIRIAVIRDWVRFQEKLKRVWIYPADEWYEQWQMWPRVELVICGGRDQDPIATDVAFRLHEPYRRIFEDSLKLVQVREAQTELAEVAMNAARASIDFMLKNVHDALVDKHYAYVFKNYTKAQLRFAVSEDKESLQVQQVNERLGIGTLTFAPDDAHARVPVIVTLPAREGEDSPSQRVVFMKTDIIFVRGGPQYWFAAQRRECYELVYEDRGVHYPENEIHVMPDDIGFDTNPYVLEVYQTEQKIDVRTVARAGL